MRKLTIASAACALTVACGVVTAAPALADGSGSGPESATGLIVASTATGTRQVLFSVIHMDGVFDGVGRIVETENLPGDEDDVSRDDLVFRQGTISIKSTTNDLSVEVDPETCLATAEISQTTEITGGTGRFSHATGTFDSHLSGLARLSRASDGTCDQNGASLVEVDRLRATGQMSL